MFERGRCVAEPQHAVGKHAKRLAVLGFRGEHDLEVGARLARHVEREMASSAQHAEVVEHGARRGRALEMRKRGTRVALGKLGGREQERRRCAKRLLPAKRGKLGAHARKVAEPMQALRAEQPHERRGAERFVQAVDHGDRLLELERVGVGLRKLHLVRGDRVAARLPGILAERLDVPKRDKLLERGMRLGRVDAEIRGMHAARPVDRFPRIDALGDGNAVEHLGQHASAHVLAGRQPEEREDGRGDVEDRTAMQPSARADAGASGGEHPEWTVPRHRIRLRRLRIGPAMVVPVAVVAHDHDRGVVARERKQRLEHHVVEAVDAHHAVLVRLELLVRDRVHLRRMELHELVAEAVDALVVDGGEIPVVARHEVGGERLHARRLREHAKQLVEAVLLLRGHALGVRHERQHGGLVELGGMDAALGELLGELGGVHGVRGKRRERRLVGASELGLVRDHRAEDRLGGVRCVPPDHIRAQPALRQDVPQRLRAAARARGRADARAVGVGLGEPKHAMRIGALAGRDGVPEDRRENWPRRGEVARGAAFEQARERRHQALRKQRLDHLPVGGVPAHEKHTARKAGSRCSRWLRDAHDARVQRARNCGRAVCFLDGLAQAFTSSACGRGAARDRTRRPRGCREHPARGWRPSGCCRRSSRRPSHGP